MRITAPPFGDMSGANDLVWSETMHQTRLLMSSWSRFSSRELQLDVNGLTLAVISHAGFGRRLDWTSNSDSNDAKTGGKGSSPSIPQGYRMSFLRAINDTTAHMAAILLLPRWLLSLTPKRGAALAHSQLDRYMREMIRTESQRVSRDVKYESEAARGNLLTSVLRASASEAAAATAGNGGKGGAKRERKEAFTEDEVMGNLFIYLLAGYETTANAILYGLIVLALRPDLQNGVIEEVDRVYAEAEKEGRTELTYADDFEKLQYTYGFMVRALEDRACNLSAPVNKQQALLLSFDNDSS